ncbi:MAG: CDP-alcohol phosphatidyltransferase family protein [Candidatus Micrarchaeota archaeon]
MIKDVLSHLQKQVGDLFSFLNIHPNHITILSVVFAALGAYLAYEGNLFALGCFLIAFLIDGLDGAIARAKGLQSAFGAYLDGICDRLVEFLALLPFFFYPEFLFPAIISLFFGTCMHSFSKAYADHREVMDAKSAAGLKSFLPRTERVIGIFLALALLLAGFISYAWYLLWILAAVSVGAFLLLQLRVFEAAKKK